MKVIINPPYTIKVEKGRKRALDLDFPIYMNVLEAFPNAEVVCLMRASNKYHKGHYTSVEDAQFPGVGVETSIFIRDPKKPEIEIKSKYEENGKLDWIRENDKTSKTTTLWHLIDRNWDKFPTGCKVPSGYVALSEVSTKNFTVFIEGEQPQKSDGSPMRMLVFIKTSNPEKMKEWLLTVVNPLHNEFRRFGDNHIDRGFTKTVKVPEELIPAKEFGKL